MSKVLTLMIILTIGGCAVSQVVPKDCGTFDTKLLRADLKTSLRYDREWQETVILMLVDQLECERNDRSHNP